MKTIYQLLVDSYEGMDLQTYYTEEDRTAAAKVHVEPQWKAVFPDRPLLEDIHEASRQLSAEGWDIYLYWFDTPTSVVQVSAAPRVTPRCRTCGKGNITRDAVAQWDDDEQEWVLINTYDDTQCQDCGDEGNSVANWVPVEAPVTTPPAGSDGGNWQAATIKNHLFTHNGEQDLLSGTPVLVSPIEPKFYPMYNRELKQFDVRVNGEYWGQLHELNLVITAEVPKP